MTYARTPAERLEIVRRSAALRWRSDPEFVPGHGNDVWRATDRTRGRTVLRVAWRGDIGRLITEGRLGRALPDRPGYPDVLGFGWTRDEHDLTWLMTRRWEGETLAEAWDGLTGRQRDRAGSAVARWLRDLHEWRPPAALADRLTLGVADRAGLPVAHGDLQLANVWWDGEQVMGVLDLERARLAAPPADLARVTELAAAGDGSVAEAHRTLRAILLREYPALAGRAPQTLTS